MIHIIEIDPQYQAQTWFAFDEYDLIRKMQGRLDLSGEAMDDVASTLKTCIAVITQASDFRIYPDDETAADELDADPFYRSREGMDAGYKLRRQLIELDVLADDL